MLPQPCFKAFESISVHLPMGKCQNIIFHTVYRSPNVSKANFMRIFVPLFRAYLSCCENIILSDSFSEYNFTQIIYSPTHTHGNILDVICVRDIFSQAVCQKVMGGGGLPCKFRQVNTRKIHKINITDFREDILNSD